MLLLNLQKEYVKHKISHHVLKGGSSISLWNQRSSKGNEGNFYILG